MIKIEELKNKKFETLEDLKEVGYNPFVSIVKQKLMIDSLMDIVIQEDESGFKTYDSIIVEITKKLACISLFMDIELGENDYENYDILKECGIIDIISCQYICIDFECLFDNRLEDVLRGNTMEHAMYRMTDRLIGIIDNTMNHVNDMLDKGDPNTIAKHLSKGIEMIAKKLPDFSQIDVLKGLENKGK